MSQESVYQLLQEHGKLRNKDIADMLGQSRSTTIKALRTLRKHGEVCCTESTNNQNIFWWIDVK